MTASLARRITLTEEMIRVEQELRTVITASPEAPTNAPPVQPAPDGPAAPEGDGA